MTFKRTLLTTLCFLIVSCSSDAKNEFEKIVSRVDQYLSEKPILLTSQRISKEGKEIYTYYGYRIVDYKLQYDLKRSFGSVSSYNAIIRISCSALDNAKSGDLFSDISRFQTDLEIISREASGFSTTQTALANNDFSKESRWIITVGYSYRNATWIYNGITGGPPSGFFLQDLRTFPQNKGFREAIGMSS